MVCDGNEIFVAGSGKENLVASDEKEILVAGSEKENLVASDESETLVACDESAVFVAGSERFTKTVWDVELAGLIKEEERGRVDKEYFVICNIFIIGSDVSSGLQLQTRNRDSYRTDHADIGD